MVYLHPEHFANVGFYVAHVPQQRRPRFVHRLEPRLLISQLLQLPSDLVRPLRIVLGRDMLRHVVPPTCGTLRPRHVAPAIKAYPCRGNDVTRGEGSYAHIYTHKIQSNKNGLFNVYFVISERRRLRSWRDVWLLVGTIAPSSTDQPLPPTCGTLRLLAGFRQ